MSGRYAFSLPEPQPRDGWFRVGQVDVTTTVLITALSVLSMVLYAIDKTILSDGVFFPELVRQGELWRLGTWPLVNPPIELWDVIPVVMFWYFGRFVEDEIGRKPYTVLVAAMVLIPGVIVTLLNLANEDIAGRWTTAEYSLSLLAIGMLAIFGFSNPNVRFFFGIPAWVIVVLFVAIEVLRDVGDRAWASLLHTLLLVAVGIFGARQRGMVDDLDFIPRVGFLTGAPASPYGVPGSARPKQKRAKRGRAGRGGRSSSGRGEVVTGPWGSIETSGPTPLEQAELDSLLDIISERGVDALTKRERERLDELRRRMRGG